MKCETIRNMMSSYIDKDLNDIDKNEMEKHLEECRECRDDYEIMLDMMAACGNLEELELPQNFRTELHQKLVEEKKKKRFFSHFMGKRAVKMATGLVAAVLVIAIGLGSPYLFSGNMNTAQKSSEAQSPAYGAAAAPAAPEAFDADISMKVEEEGQYGMEAMQPEIASVNDAADTGNSVGMQLSKNASAGEGTAAQPVRSSRSGRMVIRSGSLSVDVENVDKAAADIRYLTESSGGYVESSNIDTVIVGKAPAADGSSETKDITEKYANMTVRVPEEKFENTFNSIKNMGKTVSENITGSDITAEYRDTTAKVDNLKVQEDSLKQLMTKAKTVDEVLKIESELNRVRTEIDINTGNLKRWENLVQLSTINVYMRELKPEELKGVDVPGMREKAYKGFIKAVNNVVAALESTVVILITAIPYLAVVGVLAAVGLIIATRIKKRKKQ